MPRNGIKLVAEQKPPIQWKMTPRNGFGSKRPRYGQKIGEPRTIVPERVVLWKSIVDWNKLEVAQRFSIGRVAWTPGRSKGKHCEFRCLLRATTTPYFLRP